MKKSGAGVSFKCTEKPSKRSKLQLKNLNVPETNLIAMVLQEDVSPFSLSKGRPVLIFTVSYKGLPHLGSTLVFHNLDPIQIMGHL